MVWNDLKFYLCSKVKPFNKKELVKGIKDFWSNITIEYCNRKIDHIQRVLKKVVLLQGRPTGL
jgi:hypothetical protein